MCGCGCAQCGAPPPAPLAPNVAAFPIRYGTGELVLSATDVHTVGSGFPWGHTRRFASRLSQPTNPGNGMNWQIQEWPYLVLQDSGTVVVMGNADAVLWFDPADGPFVPRFGVRQTLTFDPACNLYCLLDLDGSATQFDGGTGAFVQHIDPAGNTIAPVSYTNNLFNFTEVQRTTVNGVTTVESLLYQYVDPSAGYPLLSSVTLRRSVNGGAWANVTQALYTYYNPGDQFGGYHDLQTVQTQTWENDAWATTGTTLYRYWLAGDSSSSSSSSSSAGAATYSLHQLKYVVLPASYDRLAAVADPLTAPDSLVAQYADHYFEYDSSSRVTKESVDGASRTFLYAYYPSGNTPGYNSWAMKTVETCPDGSQNLLYANYAGQVMLRVLQSGTDQWCHYYQYDTATADLLMHAMPSAVNGFDDTYADLINGGAYLNNNTGLIHLYQYHAPTGYLAAALIQQGTLGAQIYLRQYEYVLCTPGGSSSSSPSSSSSGCPCPMGPVYFLAAVILYPSDGQSSDSSDSSSSGGLPQIITSYAYTWYAGTARVQQRITTLPVISTAQNGSGVANTYRDYYDVYGNSTWHMDERGILTRTTYDIPTAGVTQRIDDVDTTQVSDAPPGWTTPTGAGLHLITDMTIDSEGRNTRTLGPSHTLDDGGAATVTRSDAWTVYQDGTHQIWRAGGKATGTGPSYTETLINPVTIQISDSSGRPLQQIQAVRSSTSGALQATDSFAQSSYTRWTVMQYGSDNLVSAQLVYKLIPDTGSGTVGTNYDEMDFGYDVMKRANREVTGGGTVNRTVYDVRGNPQSIWTGTNDTGATDSDPTGGGATGNNMVMVTANQYDGGIAGGDNDLTQVTQYVDSSTSRVTTFLYDWRNRRTDTDGEIDFYQKDYFDNFDRLIMTERYDTTLAGNLIAQCELLRRLEPRLSIRPLRRRSDYRHGRQQPRGQHLVRPGGQRHDAAAGRLAACQQEFLRQHESHRGPV